MFRRFEAIAGYSAAILLAVAWTAVLGRSGIAGSSTSQEVSLLPLADAGRNVSCPTCEARSEGIEVSGIFNLSPAIRNDETIALGINVAEMVNRSFPADASTSLMIRFPTGLSYSGSNSMILGSGAFRSPWSMSPLNQQGYNFQFNPTFQCTGSELCSTSSWDLPLYWYNAESSSLPIVAAQENVPKVKGQISR